MRNEGISAVFGSAEMPEVLVQAHIAKAAMLVIAISETMHVRRMVEIARTLNPGVRLALRSHNDDEAELLERETHGKVFLGEHELAHGMTTHILDHLRRVTSAVRRGSDA